MSLPETNGGDAPSSARSFPEVPDEPVDRDPIETARMLSEQSDESIVAALEQLNPGKRVEVLDALPRDRRELVLAAAPAESRRQWLRNEAHAEDTIGRLMEPALAVFSPGITISAATEQLRRLVPRAFITYLFVVDREERLLGVVAMREMLLGRPEDTLGKIMLPNPFYLLPDMSLTEAMKATITRHFPVYPVCSLDGKLVGLVRGQTLFEAQAIELSAQAGSMVGVEKEERLSTSWIRSLKFRHPWLQLNLLTAFFAAAVVGFFEDTVKALVLLAVFQPVLAGQSGNTGCQALAVTLRGMTLGELKRGKAFRLVSKEALLGACNGALVGITAGLGMFVYASLQEHPSALSLSVIVFAAMIASCTISGISGALVPLVLKRAGADPATASSIFVTTATDVASMSIFFGLARLFIPTG